MAGTNTNWKNHFRGTVSQYSYPLALEDASQIHEANMYQFIQRTVNLFYSKNKELRKWKYQKKSHADFVSSWSSFSFPHSGKAFDLEEEWVIKGVSHQDGKILRFNNTWSGYQSLRFTKTKKIEWMVESLNGQDQTVNFLGRKDKSMVGTEGALP